MKNLKAKNVAPNKSVSLLLLAAVIFATTMLATTFAAAASKAKTPTVPAFPGTLVNARYVYVTSYDGDQFDPNLYPADRDAIGVTDDLATTGDADDVAAVVSATGDVAGGERAADSPEEAS